MVAMAHFIKTQPPAAMGRSYGKCGICDSVQWTARSFLFYFAVLIFRALSVES